jgi:hypothetical protein
MLNRIGYAMLYWNEMELGYAMLYWNGIGYECCIEME